MGAQVHVERTVLGNGLQDIFFAESTGARVYGGRLDQGQGNRSFLDHNNLPQQISDSGIMIDSVLDEALCYQNGINDNQKHEYDLYEFDNSGQIGNDIKFFPGWSVTGVSSVPDYATDLYREGKRCKWNRISRIPTPYNITECCNKRTDYCSWSVNNNYETPTCDLTMTQSCIRDGLLWSDSNCTEWFDKKKNRPDRAFYSALADRARQDFGGRWGKLLWELSVYNQTFTDIHDQLLEQHCSSPRPECACKNKTGFGLVADQFPKLPAPIECVVSECKSTHPRFLGKTGREIQKRCTGLNCQITIENLKGQNQGELILFNDCLSGKKGQVRSVQDNWVPNGFVPMYKTSVVLILLLCVLILFFRGK